MMPQPPGSPSSLRMGKGLTISKKRKSRKPRWVEQPLIEQDDSQAGNGPGRDWKKTEPEKGGDDPPDGFHRTAIPRRSYTPVEMISTFSIGRIGATAAPPP